MGDIDIGQRELTKFNVKTLCPEKALRNDIFLGALFWRVNELVLNLERYER